MSKKKTTFERWFPHPFVSVIIALSWVMLAHSASKDNILLAIILAIFIPRLIPSFIHRTPHIHWRPAIILVFKVLWDIIKSNIRVARLTLSPTQNLRPKWYRVPLDTQHEQVNSLLALIITTTPGTVSAGIDQKRRDILVHSLSTDDVEQDIQEIKSRYEVPLMEIFDVKASHGERT